MLISTFYNVTVVLFIAAKKESVNELELSY